MRVEIETPTHNRNLEKNHPLEKIIGSKDKGVMKGNIVNEEKCLIYQDEHKIVDEFYKYDHWIQAMKEELDQIVKNETWELVPRPKDKNVIGTKCVFEIR